MVIQNRKNIPKGWKKRALQQCVDIDLHSLSEKTADNKNFFYIDLSAVSNGHIMFPKAKVCFKDAPSRARRIIHKGDIIFSTVRPYLKGFALVGFDSNDYIVSTGFSVLTAKNNFSSKYIYHYLFSENFQKQIFISLSGSSFPALNSKEVKGLSILIPISIAEQQKIVEVLETWDKAIQLTRKLIEQKELQKKYLMQRLLTGRTRLKGFTEKWLKLSLSDILKERNTYQTKGAEFPHLSLTKEGVAPKTARYNRDFLVKDENKSYKITLLDDICYNPANLKFGVICRNKYGAGIFSPIYVTYEIKKYDKSFVEKLLLLPTTIALARRYEEGTVYERMAVSSEDFLKLKLDFPPTEEESIEVGKVLMNSDKETDLLRQKLAKLEEQKKGLMQVLLTGKVRLAVKETK